MRHAQRPVNQPARTARMTDPSVVPPSADYKGQIVYWYNGPNQASPQIEVDNDAALWQNWNATYPGIPMKPGDNVQNLDYNDMLDKLRTAAAGNSAPDVARLPILWGPEFAAKGQLVEVHPEDFGFSQNDFWSGAIKSVMWNGKMYGIPTNNETMAFIWNKDIFQKAGLDPNTPPATWDDVVKYSAQIKQATGKAGYGMVGRVNAGNTPFRVMPVLWAYGSGALDEADPEPTYQKVYINNDGGIAALQAHYDMYVRDKSVPTSALTNTQTENGDLFISGQIAMEIAHPSEYAAMMDKANKATGPDKDLANQVVSNMAYGLMPMGPVRRAVVFGGSNIHIFADQYAGHSVDRKAANAFIAFTCGPEWSVKNSGNWTGSNPGNLQGFKTDGMKQRLDTIPFLDVTTSMLPYGIPFPVIPESTTIMNNIVPNMLQNALTSKMSVKDAADDAANQIKNLIAQRQS
jgi:multiple sugar transport system substrate-binding protein